MIEIKETPRIEHLVLVNPNDKHDPDQKCKDSIERLVETLRVDFSDKQKIVVVNDPCLKGKVYFETNEQYRLVNSEQGNIPDQDLKTIVRNKSNIKIAGGQIGKQHFGAFDSIVDYIERSKGKINDVIINIPLDGCYFRDDFFELTGKQKKEGDHAGFSIGDHFCEIGSGSSYTLKEISTITFFYDEESKIYTAVKYIPKEKGSNIDKVSAKAKHVPADKSNVDDNINEKFLRLYKSRIKISNVRTRWNVRPNYSQPETVQIKVYKK